VQARANKQQSVASTRRPLLKWEVILVLSLLATTSLADDRQRKLDKLDARIISAERKHLASILYKFLST
ncbi:hypothetical protein PENTCL1PPCAC_1617, partial [Pristionchus entomophagus]